MDRTPMKLTSGYGLIANRSLVRFDAPLTHAAGGNPANVERLLKIEGTRRGRHGDLYGGTAKWPLQ